MTPISWKDIPQEAKDLISKEQQSYQDEFTWYRVGHDYIAAYYAGECLAVWDGREWKS